ncbi:MAG: hypothetical protein QOI95_2100 [Acidimicrobiaceae bacterium]|jgi:heme-degrading monooxygenase HmoA
MIRVVYRWHLEPGSELNFARWWHERTVAIREAQEGSLGSVLLRAPADPSLFVGIARWLNVEHLEAFRRTIGPIHVDGATLDSMEILDEIDNLLVQDHEIIEPTWKEA